jgi:AraC-like DNA-binding protein
MSHYKLNILIICDINRKHLLENSLTDFNCCYKNSLSNVHESLRLKHYDFLLLFIEFNCNKIEEFLFKYISEVFPNLNSIAILKKTDGKVSHFLGKNGIMEIIYFDELDNLSSLLLRVNCTNIKLERFTNSIENYSPLLQKLLRFIEKYYLSILTISEIADSIGINESTVDREFQKSNLGPPKRLLLHFKVMHSMELLCNTDLRIKEVACLSGFTSVQRYIECFIRIYKMSPAEYRKREVFVKTIKNT